MFRGKGKGELRKGSRRGGEKEEVGILGRELVITGRAKGKEERGRYVGRNVFTAERGITG